MLDNCSMIAIQPAAKRLLQRALSPKQKSKSLSLEVAAWLLVILDKEPAYTADVILLRSYIDSQIKETASTASANEIGYDGLWDYCIFGQSCAEQMPLF
jgi:hypothetical protein